MIFTEHARALSFSENISEHEYSNIARKPQFIVMRHGKAQHNAEEVYNSTPSHPNYTVSKLTKEGVESVLHTAARLLQLGFNAKNISMVFVSPLPRAIQTAEILWRIGLCYKKSIIIDKRLMEFKVGDLENLSKINFPWGSDEDMKNKYHTESMAHITKRIIKFCQYLNTLQRSGHILIITHGVPAYKFIETQGYAPFKPPAGSATLIPQKVAKL